VACVALAVRLRPSERVAPGVALSAGLFVLIGGTELAPATVLKWLVLHVVVLGGAVIALLALAWRRTRRAPTPPTVADSPRAEALTAT